MKPKLAVSGMLAAAALCAAPIAASARGLSVELWTDRGSDAVYQPGDPIQIKARTSTDAYLLVYEIDAEGGVHLLFPSRGQSAEIEAHHTYRLPDDDQGELVVDASTGEGYIVAIASDSPFDELPWYLRPYDPQGDEVGYVGEPDQEEGVTADGKIVGDPFVAMERIRRRVLRDSRDGDAFATAYTTYYVHDRVRYPRYICYDCHRPGLYNWWSGFDPYYTSCSVFDFRVNWSWGWGPRYWFGSVPYFVYVYRNDCPPAYRRYAGSGIWYSSWDGWNRWCNLWGSGGLRRYKSAPPASYTPPAKWASTRSPREVPPGFLAGSVGPGGRGMGAGHEVNRGEPGGIRERRGDGTLPGRDERPGELPRGWTGDGRTPRDRGPAFGSPGLQRPREEGPDRRDVPPVPPRREERPRELAPPRQEPRRESAPRPERAPREVGRGSDSGNRGSDNRGSHDGGNRGSRDDAGNRGSHDDGGGGRGHR